ncbi:hypothetical protein [Methylorubrum populi]|uniref:Uncharacterized protein n=1 Tax=Methylorubrum populi TaxID=223967 RepID=A0A833MZI1_9HYPH|nr:hypothetical protein [Methylorubrum populi]KAB7783688.1 hypothetical protein F8B43_3611 [Methylorubrum populi]
MTQPDHGEFVLPVQTDPIVGLDRTGAGFREPVRTAPAAARGLADRSPALAVMAELAARAGRVE